MKRKRDLFDGICQWENLRLAFYNAARGKRERAEVRQFGSGLERNLQRLGCDLRAGTIEVGEYLQWIIHDPKRRVITAPSFRVRVLHHAIMNVCEPVFDRWLIPDTFACRCGKGQVAALARAKTFAARFGYFLKLDIRKYFDSVSHPILLERLARKFKDRPLLELFTRIVDSHHTAPQRGLPIGTLTSQHFANFYLGWLDRFVKEQLQVKGYVRYMDDMVLWGDDRAKLESHCAAVQAWLDGQLALQAKPPVLHGTNRGMEFLGVRVYPTHLALARRSRHRFRKRLKELEAEYLGGAIGEPELQQRASALVAFTRIGGARSWRFRRRVLQGSLVSGHRPPTG